MSEIRNAAIAKNANVYFDGKVTSRSIQLADGSRQSLGIMLPGEYEFNTVKKEIMEITSGDLEVALPATEGWQRITDGEEFVVPANSSFKLRVLRLTDYCCSYIDETE